MHLRLATSGTPEMQSGRRKAPKQPTSEPPRRKVGRPKSGKPRARTVLALKGQPAWKEWLDAFSRHCRLGLADTIEQALIEYAKQRGYTTPPKR
jgi:hypothetical protein